MKNLLTEKHLVNSPIENGDAGLILKADGTFQIFSTGEVNPDRLTDRQIDQGRKLNALALALAIPNVMHVLLQMADDPQIVGDPGIRIGAHH